MTVRRIPLKSGNLSDCFYYEFMIDGKRYRGPTNKTTEREAAAVEKAEKERIKSLRQNKTAKAVIENYLTELGHGNEIQLDEVWERFISQPRRFNTCEKSMSIKKSYWIHFLDHCKNHGLKTMQSVSESVAKSYLFEFRKLQLSPRAINARHGALTEIFSLLAKDAGLHSNPFSGIPKIKLRGSTEHRDAFTPEELKLIGEKADPFVYAIFAIGMTTALREGDICTLRRSEVDAKAGWITRKLLKTGEVVKIPILPPLLSFLQTLPADGEFILPDHAKMYLENPTGITYRVKKFLEDKLGMVTTRIPAGRSRSVSVKDVHSLRHTFCYLASLYQIPFPVVKSIVGHVDEKMTMMYSDHADGKAKIEHLAKMPNLLGLPVTAGPKEDPLSAAIAAMDSATDKNWRQKWADLKALM